MSETGIWPVLRSSRKTRPEFARGFECGRLWALLRAEPDEEVEEYVHAENAEMLLRMAEATERHVQTEDVADQEMKQAEKALKQVEQKGTTPLDRRQPHCPAAPPNARRNARLELRIAAGDRSRGAPPAFGPRR